MSIEREETRRTAVTNTAAYLATVESLEPCIHPIDALTFYASAAISLKRIADVTELFAMTMIKDHAEKDKEMRDWAHRHGFGDLWDKSHG